MSDQLRNRLFNELDSIHLIDPHSHIEPKSAASKTLADILGYHYYTELIHSAGMPRTEIERAGIDPKEKVRRLVERIEPLRNTVQYSWLLELARTFFDFPPDEHLTTSNWESLYDSASRKMAQPDWEQQVLDRTKLDSIFLTNNFDDPLDGFDTSRYVPCLRTDDLVFHLGKPDVRQRLEKATGTDVKDAASLRSAIGKLFQHFVGKGARACAISLPPSFAPRSEEHTSELQSQSNLVCRLLLEKKKKELPTPYHATMLSQNTTPLLTPLTYARSCNIHNLSIRTNSISYMGGYHPFEKHTREL